MSTSRTPRLTRIAAAAVIAVLAACGGYLALVFAWLHSYPVTGFRGGVMWIRNCEEKWDENAEGLCPLLYCETAIRESGRLHGTTERRPVASRQSGRAVRR